MSKIRIGGDTSGIRKSLLDLGKDLKALGKNKVSVFSDQDRKFIKEELNKELSTMKSKLSENRVEISKLIQEQRKLEKGSEAELSTRKKIINAFQQQTRLAQQLSRVKTEKSEVGGGGFGGMLGKAGTLAKGGILAVLAAAGQRTVKGTSQYMAGVPDRVRLRGLGVQESSFGSADELAGAGLTEQQLIRRRVQATSRLGRAGASNESIMGQSRFERSFGLEEGSMMNVAGSLRGSFGGKGADQAQQKLQASILASGIEDAIGPYLETATDLLADINQNGVTNTDEMVRIFATLTKDGKRTPEQIAAAFQGIDKAVKGATGEANAFMQTAFSRGGIGGGTIGATRLAMSSGGVMGLNEDELAKRGYNPDLLKNMKGAGFMSGVGDRSGAMLKQYKQSAGMKPEQKIGDVSDLNTMVGLSQMANSTLGTEGLGGFDALKMMEQVQSGQMSQKQFETQLQDMKDKKDPTVDRLNKINTTLEGQTDVLNNINTNLLETLGKTGVKGANVLTEADNMLIQGTANVAQTVDSSGIGDAAMNGMSSLRKNTTGGGLGSKIYDMFQSVGPGVGTVPPWTDAVANAVKKGAAEGVASGNRQQQIIQNKNNVNLKIMNGDGRVSNKTHR